MSLVIDASVAAKWIFPDEGSEIADEILNSDEELIAPELIYYEIGNILWKRVRRGATAPELAKELINEFVQIPIKIADSRVLSESSLAIAVAHGRTFYDSVYLALAVARDSALVTADERLVNSLANTDLASRVRLLERYGA